MDSRRGTPYSVNFSPTWLYENTARSPEFLSRQFNDRVGAYLSARFLRLGVDANTVTTLGIVVHLATAVIVLSLPLDSRLPAAMIVLVGWQVAYTLDCSDGQVARATNTQSPAGAVLDLLADYFSHSIVLCIVWLKIAALSTSVVDDVTPELAALFALSGGGWFAALHNQALAGADRARAGVIQRTIGRTPLLKIALLVRHLMDTSLVVIALAVAMTLGGQALLWVFLAISTLRMTFIVVRYLGLFLIARQTKPQELQESFC